MSHSSGYGVQVSAAELGRRRAVGESQGRCTQLREQARAAAHAAVDAGSRFIEIPDEPSIAAGDSADSAAKISAGYERRIRRVLDEVASARALAILAAFDAEALPSISGTISIAWKRRDDLVEVAQRENADYGRTSSESADASTERAKSMLASLAELLDSDRREELAARISAAIGARDATKRLDAAFRDVDQAYREQARVEGVRSEAREIVTTLRTYATPAAIHAREALAAATTRAQLKAAAELATTARTESEAREEEAFVVEQTAAVLKELGYDVGGSFIETAERGDFAVATNAQLKDYGLQVRIIDGGKRVLTNTVALDDHTSVAADVAAEEHVCADLATVAERLGRRGVRLDRYFESKPGEMPIERRVDIRADDPKLAATRTGRRATGAREAHP